MNKIEKLFSVLQEMENTKLDRPTISELTDTNETKMDLLVMNLLSEKVMRISELNKLINEHGDNIIISTMPITKYNGDVYIMKYEFSLETIKSLINGVGKEKVIIYSDIDGGNSNKLPYKYRCAVVGNVNHPEQYKPINDEDNLKLPFIYHKPIPISEIDFSEPKPMMNPITYELINPELWEDGLHLQPNLMDENLEINMVFEVKDKKVVRVYKSKA